MKIADKLHRVIYREFLLEPDLLAEVGLETLPQALASELNCPEEEAVERLTASPLLEALDMKRLKALMVIRDMTLVSRTAAALSAELKREAVSYDHCCRMALCYAVVGSHGHVFGALRAAASKNDGWARHHYLYGLILGLEGSVDRARWEMGMALQYEPYEEGRARIRMGMDILDGTL